MRHKINKDVKSDYLTVVGIVSVVIILLVIAILSKYINSNVGYNDLIQRMDHNYDDVQLKNDSNVTIHLIKKHIFSIEIKNADYQWGRDNFIDLNNQKDRVKDNWEFRTIY